MMFIIGTGSSDGLAAADIAVERQVGVHGGGLGDGQRHAEDGVGTDAALVGRAVELDQRVVDLDLLARVEAGQQVHDLGVDRGDRLQDALAAVALLVAVAQFDRLVRAGRGARRHGRAAPWRRCRARLRPRPWDCRGCRGFRGRGHRQ